MSSLRESLKGPLRPNSSRLGLVDTALVLLRDLISERTAVHFDDAKLDLLADKLSEVVTARGLASFLDYYYLLRYDDDAAKHWASLMDRLAVPETYFWRQADQFTALAKLIAPAHFAREPHRPLKVWSAACCTGEEPLSVAIALAEAGLLSDGRIEIVASDASGAMLDRAREGVYRERSFRQLPPTLREKYFRQVGPGEWRAADCLSQPIAWRRANLADEREWAEYAAADVIFCRNVFIYFSDAGIKRVARAFADRMPSWGHLFLGASESLTRFGLPFELLEIEGSFVYVKGGQHALAKRETAMGPVSGDRLPPSRLER